METFIPVPAKCSCMFPFIGKYSALDARRRALFCVRNVATFCLQWEKKKNVIVLFFQTVSIVSSQQSLFRLISKLYPRRRASNELIDILDCLIQGPCWFSQETNHFPLPSYPYINWKKASTWPHRCRIFPANTRLGFCLNEPNEMSYRDSEYSAHEGSRPPVVETLSANPRHGQRNEEAQRRAEEECCWAEHDL